MALRTQSRPHLRDHVHEKDEKATGEDKKKAIARNKAPPCRFWFLHIVSIVLQTPLGERRRKIRRRGKELVELPYVASTNDHNEYGLVMPERPQPFGSPSSDVI